MKMLTNKLTIIALFFCSMIFGVQEEHVIPSAIATGAGAAFFSRIFFDCTYCICRESSLRMFFFGCPKMYPFGILAGYVAYKSFPLITPEGRLERAQKKITSVEQDYFYKQVKENAENPNNFYTKLSDYYSNRRYELNAAFGDLQDMRSTLASAQTLSKKAQENAERETTKEQCLNANKTINDMFGTIQAGQLLIKKHPSWLAQSQAADIEATKKATQANAAANQTNAIANSINAGANLANATRPNK